MIGPTGRQTGDEAVSPPHGPLSAAKRCLRRASPAALSLSAGQSADEVGHCHLPHRAQLRLPPRREPAGQDPPRAPEPACPAVFPTGARAPGGAGSGHPAASPAACRTVPVRAELMLPEQRSPSRGQPARLRPRGRKNSRSPRRLQTPIRNRRPQDSSQVFVYPARQKPKQHRVHTTRSPPGCRTRPAYPISSNSCSIDSRLTGGVRHSRRTPRRPPPNTPRPDRRETPRSPENHWETTKQRQPRQPRGPRRIHPNVHKRGCRTR
jgi:hypothetical protein